MRMKIRICRAIMFLSVIFLYAQQNDNPIYMDFRNQKISDIIYSVAEVCGESVIIDETVTGNATFRFEDRNFESALGRFAEHCQLYVEQRDGIYFISKVHIESLPDGNIRVNTENVLIEPFLNLLSRFTNRTILYDSLPSATITIRAQNSSLEDVLNLTIVKLPGFGLERIADGYYVTKSSGTQSRKNVDVFTISEVGGLFSCSIQRAAFTNVVETLFAKGNREFCLLSRLNLQLESIVFSNKGFDDLLSLILFQANCDFSVSDGVYYIYEIQKKDILKKFKETRLVKIRNLTTDALMSLMPAEYNSSSFIKVDKNTNTVILTGSPSEINPIEEFIAMIDVPVTDRSFKSFYLENVSVKDAVSAIPKNLLLSDIIYLPLGNGFITQVSGESEVKLTEFISLLDSKKENKSIRLRYIRGEELVKALPPSVGKDNISLSNDPSLIFFSGTDRQYEEFLNDLKIIDCPKQQIKYQLLVVQRQRSNSLNWNSGLSMKGTDSPEGVTLKSGTLSNIFKINFDVIAQFGLEFSETLNAELSDGKSRVLADTTLNGISGERLSFANTSTFRYRDILPESSSDRIVSTIREITSGLTISIDGWVSGDDMITVKVDAQVSKSGTSNSSGLEASESVANNNPPITTEKKVSTNIRAKSGELVVIGGLFQQDEDISEKKAPVLGDIPLLGNLFKSRKVDVTESEFVIYLVPSVYHSVDVQFSEEENLSRLKEKYGLDE